MQFIGILGFHNIDSRDVTTRITKQRSFNMAVDMSCSARTDNTEHFPSQEGAQSWDWISVSEEARCRRVWIDFLSLP